jgi:hypothetical protein
VVAWHPTENCFFTGAGNGEIHLHNLYLHKDLLNVSYPFTGTPFGAMLCCNADGSTITCGCRNETLTFDVATGKCINRAPTGYPTGFSVAWSPDRSKLLTADGRNLYLWNSSDLLPLDTMIESLSVTQWSLLVSLYDIDRKRWLLRNLVLPPQIICRPIRIPKSGSVHATFETLPQSLQQLLLQNNCVQLVDKIEMSQPTLLQQTKNAVANFVQQHQLGLGMACVAGMILLSYLCHR